MKRFLLILITLPMLLMGCAKDGEGVGKTDDGIGFIPTTYADEITEYVWGIGEEVGIFMVPLTGKINDGTTVYSKYKYAEVATKGKLEPAIPAEKLVMPKGKSVTFVSYKPYDGNLVTNLYKFNVDVADQSDYKKIDLIYSNQEIIYNPMLGVEVDLTYKHMMSKVVLRFKNTDVTFLGTLRDVKITGMPTKVAFDMLTDTYGTPTADDVTIDVISVVPVVPADPTVKVFEAIIIPQPTGWTNAKRTFHFTTSAASEEYVIIPKLAFEPGMMYVFDIDVLLNGGIVAPETPNVVPWGDGGKKELDYDITDKFTDLIFRKYVSDKYSHGRRILFGDVYEVKKVEFALTDLTGVQTIASLNGIEYFQALEELLLPANLGLTGSLKLSANSKLKILSYNNDYNYAGPKLTKLSVEGCRELTNLSCSYNALTSLNMFNNTALTNLSCAYNKLPSLDVSNLTALTNLNCASNQLPSLDISKSLGLTNLWCVGNKLTSLNVSSNTALTNLNCSNNLLEELAVDSNRVLISLQCSGNKLSNIELIKNKTLRTLHCYSNKLSELDVSTNTSLMDLRCYSNILITLKVPENTMFTTLLCHVNQIISLDLSSHPDIKKIITINFSDNAGNGTTAGTPNPADFVVKLPTGSSTSNPAPGVFPTINSTGGAFQWPYQFRDEAGVGFGEQFNVKTQYTVAP